MDTTVIIAVYNEVRTLDLVLAALDCQTADDFEVVIADDGSGKEMASFISETSGRHPYSIKHVWHEDRGWRKNEILNRAIVASEGRYLLFLDGDCIPHPKWIEEHKQLRAPGLVVAGRRGQIPPAVAAKLTAEKVHDNVKFRRSLFWKAFWRGILDGESYAPISCLRITSPLLRRMLKVRKGIWGCNFGAWRDDIIRVNGFDERFVKPCVGEDTDIEARLTRGGAESRRYSHIAMVYHCWHKPHRGNIDDSLAMYEENNRQGVIYTPYGINK